MPSVRGNPEQLASGPAALLCPSCRRYVGRQRTWCTACGRALANEAPPLEIVLEDETRVALTTSVTIGRASDSSVRLRDLSVSREHARVRAARPGGWPLLEDAGSTYGTWLDGRRLAAPAALHEGATIRVGDVEMTVERPRDPADAGRTLVIRGDARAHAEMNLRGAGTSQPRLRPGSALKRLEAAEGERRWVLRDIDDIAALRLGDAEAQLVGLLDGHHSLVELIAQSERRNGPAGLAVLTRLLATLADHGLLAGVKPSPIASDKGWLQRQLTPRTLCLQSADALLKRAYAAGGWRLFTRSGLATFAAVASAGVVALAATVARDDATPFVATSLGLGAVVFVLGRLLVAWTHELAHGLMLVALGRAPGRCGVKFVLGFPYAFVDTTAVLFEPRRRRIAVSGAGPAADLTMAGAFALGCLVLPRGAAHDICFELSLIAYLAALANLNPVLDRDGYHVLVDWLGVPGLRRHARQWLAAGEVRGDDARRRVVAWYAAATIAWGCTVAGFVVMLSLRYLDDLLSIVSASAAWAVLIAAWSLALLPVLGILGRPASRLVLGLRGRTR